MFTLAEARALLPDVLERAAELIQVRADVTEISASLAIGAASELGGLPEAKAGQARLHELLTWFTGNGLQVKGWAPLLLDFPTTLDGQPALLCWLEGDISLAWWHRPELGFAGRRPLG
jgi:hypothetical protein